MILNFGVKERFINLTVYQNIIQNLIIYFRFQTIIQMRDIITLENTEFYTICNLCY